MHGAGLDGDSLPGTLEQSEACAVAGEVEQHRAQFQHGKKARGASAVRDPWRGL